MPAKTFFAMLKHGRRIHSYRLAELADLHAIAICDHKYHSRLKGHYLGLAVDKTTQVIEPARPSMDAGGNEAKEMMFGFFAAKKGLIH